MVQRYEPYIKKDYGWNEWEDSEDAMMRQSPTGEWVKLTTYDNRVAELEARIEQLRKLLGK